MEQCLYSGIFWHHKIEVSQICGFGPFHESSKNGVEDVEIFYLEELVNNCAEIPVEMVSVLSRNQGDLTSQSNYFGHYQSVCLLLLELILYYQKQPVVIFKSDLLGFVVGLIRNQTNLQVRF